MAIDGDKEAEAEPVEVCWMPWSLERVGDAAEMSVSRGAATKHGRPVDYRL